MQFELKSFSAEVKLEISEWGVTEATKESLYLSFKRLGGVEGMHVNCIKQWKFPLFITSQIISEIIHNTCFVCGGLMTDSTAFQNTYASFDDFGNDAGQRGTTQSRIGPAKQIKVRKCSQCGHSHT